MEVINALIRNLGRRPLNPTTNHLFTMTAFTIVLVSEACTSKPDPRPDFTSPIATLNTGGIGGGGGAPDGAPVVSNVAGSHDGSLSFCGDGIVSGDEECEGSSVVGVTCEMREAGVGTVRCNATTCRLDFSQCQVDVANAAGLSGVSSDAGTAGTVGTAGNTAGSNGASSDAGTVGTAGTAGTTAGTSGTAGTEVIEPPECAPNAVETQTCGVCGEQTRTCLPNSKWGEFTACDDSCANLPPECASQTEIPTWENGVGSIVQSRCAPCHLQANQYSSVAAWRNFDRYVQIGHFIVPPESDIVNCWIALGKPEN